VLSPQGALDDPHVQASGFLAPLDYPGAPVAPPITDFPVDLSATPGRARGRAPLLGEHTDAVLAELGYSADEIRELTERGIVTTPQATQQREART